MFESIFSKETPTQVFSCEIFEILKNIQHLFLQNNSGGCFYLYLKGGSVQIHLNLRKKISKIYVSFSNSQTSDENKIFQFCFHILKADRKTSLLMCLTSLFMKTKCWGTMAHRKIMQKIFFRFLRAIMNYNVFSENVDVCSFLLW